MSSRLLVVPDFSKDEYIRVTPETAGWQHLSFAVRRMKGGDSWESTSGESELALVLLGGVCAIRSNRGEWSPVGHRSDVFSGMPYTLYLPRRTQFRVEAMSDRLEIAYGWCAVEQDGIPCLVSPEQVEIEIRGGENATRQINRMIPPGFPCQRLVAVEVYTPSGNWSSYPPHKHDTHLEDGHGNLLEADLEEIYFYKINRPEGYAYQRVYSGDGRLDELVMVRDNHLVLVPEGYHPVVSAHGYVTYYLNFLAGDAQSLASSDDPQYAWIKTAWHEKDARLPVVSMEMEREAKWKK